MKLAWLMWISTILPHPVAEQTCLATMVYLEARSESTLGQLAVAEVALRRRDRGRWGHDVCAVVKAPGQFAVTTTSPNYDLGNPDAWQKAWDVAGRALTIWSKPAGKRKQVVPNADHFVAADSPTSPAWVNGPPLATIGGHNFYRIN